MDSRSRVEASSLGRLRRRGQRRADINSVTFAGTTVDWSARHRNPCDCAARQPRRCRLRNPFGSRGPQGIRCACVAMRRVARRDADPASGGSTSHLAAHPSGNPGDQSAMNERATLSAPGCEDSTSALARSGSGWRTHRASTAGAKSGGWLDSARRF